jgi:hypothetical protein
LVVSLNKLVLLFAVLVISSCFLDSKEYNFTEDVAPIIFENCSSCHHKKGPAPFAMEKYHDVAKRAKMVAHVTQSGYMPPWPADTKYRHFIGEKTLTEQEKTILQEWYLQGALPGDTSGFVNYKYVSKLRSNLGKPDLVVRMVKPFFIPGDNKDRFMVAKFPFTIPADTNIRLIEFVPDNKQLVHHVNAHLLTYKERKDSHLADVLFVNSEDHSDSSAFYELNIPYETGEFPYLNPSITNYLPGVEPFIFPEGIGGARLTKQSAILVKDFHYGPSPKDDWDNSYFNIYFDTKKPKRPLQELIIGTQGKSPVKPPLVIPANKVKKFTSEYKINQDLSVLTLNPHMHLIGKEFKAFAVLPVGDTIPLIKINDWNFRWQYFYTVPKMLFLPKGTLIKVEALFDNTPNNMDNPFNPPQIIMGRNGSMKTTDEMLQLIITYLPYQKGDEFIKLSENE